MTTIRDLLNDLIEEVSNLDTEFESNARDGIDNRDYHTYTTERKEELLDEYIETIINRIVG